MTTPQRYRKLPVVIEAIQWTGDNADAVKTFVGHRVTTAECRFLLPSEVAGVDHEPQLWVDANRQWLPIETGEWVARDEKGFYPIKADVFAKTYEAEDQ